MKREKYENKIDYADELVCRKRTVLATHSPSFDRVIGQLLSGADGAEAAEAIHVYNERWCIAARSDGSYRLYLDAGEGEFLTKENDDLERLENFLAGWGFKETHKLL